VGALGTRGEVQLTELAECVPRRLCSLFALSAAGHGCRAVAAKLDREKVPTWESTTARWHDPLIRRIVRGREALGEFQPKTRGAEGERKYEGAPIVGYYPAAVTEAEWLAAKTAREGRYRKGGRPPKDAKLNNLFAGLLYDGPTGDRITTINRHKQKVLVTSGFRRHGDSGTSFPLVPFERSILSQLDELNPAEILGTGDGPDEVAELEAKIARVDSVLRSLADQFDDGGEEIPAIAQKVKAKNAERKALAIDLENAESRAASPLSAAWGDPARLAVEWGEHDVMLLWRIGRVICSEDPPVRPKGVETLNDVSDALTDLIEWARGAPDSPAALQIAPVTPSEACPAPLSPTRTVDDQDREATFRFFSRSPQQFRALEILWKRRSVEKPELYRVAYEKDLSDKPTTRKSQLEKLDGLVKRIKAKLVKEVAPELKRMFVLEENENVWSLVEQTVPALKAA
jgi:hypothetical protein